MTEAQAAETLASILTISPSERTVLPGPPGAPFVREQCVDDGHVWVGIVTTEPGTSSPWHHHGEHTTYAYVLEGEGTIEFGDGESKKITADGTLGVVPKGLVHREINTGSTKNKFLIMRVGDGPTVVPVER